MGATRQHPTDRTIGVKADGFQNTVLFQLKQFTAINTEQACRAGTGPNKRKGRPRRGERRRRPGSNGYYCQSCQRRPPLL